MRIYRNLIPTNVPTAVALGFFDGVHLGHRAVIGSAAACKSEGLTPVLFTFNSTPKSRDVGAQLSTPEDKLKILEHLGVEIVYVLDFELLRNKTPEEFVHDILCGVFGAKRVFCGFNYHFGSGGSGDTAMLRRLCRQCGIRVTVQKPVELGGIVVSSSEIRRLLKNGYVELANTLLGYDFGIRGRSVEGNHIGTYMHTPTINLSFEDGIILPKFGVYASVVTVDGKTYDGVTNIGVKPTIAEDNKPNCETWLPQYTGGELYGKTVDVRLKRFIRPERKFNSLDELKAAIVRDGNTAVEMLSKFNNN